MAGKSGANGTELGVGYVSLTVDSSGVADEIETELGVAGKKAGSTAGKNASGEFNAKLKDGVQKGGLAAGAVAVAGIAAGLKTAQAQVDLAGTIQAQLGTTPEYAKEIAEAAGDAYASGWGESLEEVGSTAAVLGQALKSLGDDGDIEGLSVKLTALSDGFDQDAKQMSETAENMVRNGLAKNMTEAVDLITVGFQSNSEMADDMLDSLSEYGSAFGELGLSGADAITAMNQGIDSGAWNGDAISDGVREHQIRIREMSDETSEALATIGMSSTDMQKAMSAGGPAAREAMQTMVEGLRGIEDPVARNAAAIGLFGTKAEEMQGALMSLDFDSPSAGMEAMDGAASDFVTSSMGFDQQIDAIGRTLSDGLAEALIPLLPQMKALADVGLVFFKWLADNPVITGIILGVGVALGVVAGAMFVLNSAMLLSPITWIILAIVAAIAIVIGAAWLLYDNWDAVWAGMSAAGNWFVDTIALGIENIRIMWENMTGWISEKWGDGMHNVEVGLMNMLVFATHVWNGMIHGANGVIHAINGIARAAEYVLSLNGLFGDWGWGEADTFGLVDIPGLATGGTVTGSGTVLVGEEGPELLKLPGGASVIPLDHPASGVGGQVGGKTVNLTVNNPTAEKTSVTIRKASQLTGASLGV